MDHYTLLCKLGHASKRFLSLPIVLALALAVGLAPQLGATEPAAIDCAQVEPEQSEVVWDLPAPRTQDSYAEHLDALLPLGFWRFLDANVVHDETLTADGAYFAGSTSGAEHGTTGQLTTGPIAAGATGAISLRADQKQFIEIPHDAAFVSDQGSITLWVRPDASPEAALPAHKKSGLFSKDSSAYDDGGQITLWYRGTNDFRVRLQSTTTSYHVESSDRYFPGRWHHVVVTFGDNGLRLFVNGVLVDSDEYTGGLGLSSGGSGNAEPIVLGASADRSSDLITDRLEDYFTGQLAEVAVLNTELTAAEVATLHAHRFPLVSDYAEAVLARSPAAYYRMGEELGQEPGAVLHDAAGNLDGSYQGNSEGGLAGIIPGSTATRFQDSSFARVDGAASLRMTEDFSASLWLRPDAIAGTLFECSGTGAGSAHHTLYRLALDTDGIHYTHDHELGMTELHLGGAISTGEWTHVVVTRTGADGRVELFVNGDRVSSVTAPLPTGGASADLQIGSGTLAGSQFFGLMAELALFARVLDDQEVALLADSRVGRSVTVERDGIAIATLPWTDSALQDFPEGPGPFEYCVRATDNGTELPTSCCSLRMLQSVTELACVEAEANGLGGVQLTWVAGEEYSAVQVHRNDALVATLPGNAISFFDTEALPGTLSYSIVPLVDDVPAHATTCEAALRLAPTQLECAVDADRALLTWDTPRQYDFTLVFQNDLLIATLPGTTHTYTVAGLSPAPYTFEILGEIADTTTGGTTTSGTVLPAPAEFTGCNENGGINLSWIDPVGFDTIEIRRNGALIAVVPGNLQSFYVPGDGDGGHDYSATGRASGTASLPAHLTSTTLLAPTNFAGEVGSNCGSLASVYLSWTNTDSYDAIELWKGGSLAANLAGNAQQFSDLVTVADQTIAYTVVGIRDGFACGRRSTESSVVVAVPAPLDNMGLPEGLESCVADTAALVLDVTPAGDPALYSFEWRHNGHPLAANTQQLLISSPTAADSGTYEVRVDNGCSSVTHSVTITLFDAHAVQAPAQDAELCPGETTMLLATVTGTNPVLQWLVDGVTIPGATAETLVVAALPSAGSAGYELLVTDDCGSSTTPIATITTLSQPELLRSPTSTEVCTATDVTLTVEATGAELTYQWRVDGNPIAGATDASLHLLDVNEDLSGSYDVVITSACGTLTSDAAVLTVRGAPDVAPSLPSLTRCPGARLDLQAEVTEHANNAGLSFQWLRNGDPISGATTRTLTLASLTSEHAGEYACVVSNSCGTTTTNPTDLTVLTPPTVTAAQTGMTAGLTACDGDLVTFTAVATGTAPLSFQWFRDGVAIEDGTAATLSVAANAGNAGAFTVRVTNDCGSTLSAPATLQLATPVAIASNPADAVQCAGETTTLSVAVEGTGPFTYEWFHNGTPLTTNAPALQVTTSEATIGSYQVFVTGACGTTASEPATLSLTQPPVLNSSPLSAVACPGSELTLSVTATGVGLSYQWHHDGAPIAGATAAALDLFDMTASDAGAYHVEVANACGSINSAPANVTIAGQPLITKSLFDMAVCSGDHATLRVVAISAGEMTYSWLHNGELLDETSNTLTLTDIDAASAGNYEVLVGGPCGLVASSAAVTVNDAPAILTQPTGATLCAASHVTLTAEVAGEDVSYQWYLNGEELPGANATTLSLANVTPDHAGSYWVTAATDCGVVTSDLAEIVVTAAPEVATSHQSLELCVDDSATIEVVATGTAPLLYEWRKNDQVIPGASAAQLALGPVTVEDSGQYSVLVSNSCGSVEVSVATVTVSAPPVILQQPFPQIACAGDPVALVVAAVGTDLSYQWRHEGVAIAGANSRTLQLDAVTPLDAGAYDVVVSSRCGAIVSAEASVQVHSAPQITESPKGTALFAGEAMTFTVAADGSGPLAYQWFHNGAPIVNATQAKLTVTQFTSLDAGDYFVVVSNSCDSVASDTFAVTLALPADPFRRGDANDDGGVNTADAIFLLNYLFANGTQPPCMDAGDVDDNGSVNISDAVQLLNYLFAGAAAPAAPFASIGSDPTPDELPCARPQSSQEL